MDASNDIHVEVAFAQPEEQVIIPVRICAGATAQEAIEASGVLARFPEIDLAGNQIGIFGKRVPLDHPLLPGDRVEIYRPLQADPKEARRRRAKNA